MRKALLIGSVFFLLALTAPKAAAQVTAVSGTVTDPNGIPYAGAQIKAQLSTPGATVTITNQAQCTAAGAGTAPCKVPIPGTVGPIALNSLGSFTLNLYSNTSITPAGTKWLFSFAISPGIPLPLGTGPQSTIGGTVGITITGATQSVSAALSAAAPALTHFSAPPGSCPGTAVSPQIFYDNAGSCAGILGSAVNATTGAISLTAGADTTTPFSVNGHSATQSVPVLDFNSSAPLTTPQRSAFRFRGLGVGTDVDAFYPSLVGIETNAPANGGFPLGATYNDATSAEPITSVSITSNVVTIACDNSNGNIIVDTYGPIVISGLTGASFLNGQTLVALTASPTGFTAAFTHADYGPTSDSGTAFVSNGAGSTIYPTGAWTMWQFPSFSSIGFDPNSVLNGGACLGKGFGRLLVSGGIGKGKLEGTFSDEFGNCTLNGFDMGGNSSAGGDAAMYYDYNNISNLGVCLKLAGGGVPIAKFFSSCGGGGTDGWREVALGKIAVSGTGTPGNAVFIDLPTTPAASFNFNLPVTAGLAGQVLTSQGGGSTPMTWTSAFSSVITCGATAACGNTAVTSPRVVIGSATTSGGTPSNVTVTGISPAFASNASYRCTGSPNSTSGTAAAAPEFSYVTGASFTITTLATVAQQYDYICIGN